MKWWYDIRLGLQRILQKFIRWLSPGWGFGRHFVWLNQWLEKVLWPPKAPEKKSVRIQTRQTVFDMYLSQRDPNISAQIYRDKIWEPGVTYVLEKRIQPGRCMLDLGAHIGYYSLLAGSILRHHGKVVAFEPDPENQKLLRSNITLNALEKTIHIACHAVSDQKQELILSGSNPDDTSDRTLGHASDCRYSHRVQCVRVDDYMQEHLPEWFDKVCLIKMDVEGFETFAVRGMQSLIKANPEICLITEVNFLRLKNAGTSEEEYLDLLWSMGFTLHQMTWAGDRNEVAMEKVLGMDALKSQYIDLDNSHADLLCVREP